MYMYIHMYMCVYIYTRIIHSVGRRGDRRARVGVPTALAPGREGGQRE